jgi:hypothetical protein
MPPGGAHTNARNWTLEEDTLILEMSRKYGPVWLPITEKINEMNGPSVKPRTQASVRNRIQRIERAERDSTPPDARFKRVGSLCMSQTPIDTSLKD